ncbi:MAG: hypothetical protein HY721_00520 [Planctomycetes bacterium]|nr:hypothetical protein [Planctomycetota bacterium]
MKRSSRRVLPAALAAAVIASLALSPGARAQQAPLPPDFDLRVVAPSRVEGEPLSIHRIEAAVVLATRQVPGSSGIGAQGWALSLRPAGGARIVGATFEGTAGDDVPRGFFRDGFRITEITSGPDNEGVLSAVALSLTQPAKLPPEGEETLLRLTLECQVPEAASSPRRAGIEFRDGLRGSAQPVNNAITFVGQSRKDDGGPKDLDQDREQPAEILCCIVAPFLRGDCALDLRIDITDAIVALGYLFLGNDEPPCLNACDVDDNETVNITDPIYLLNHLFLGGPPVPPPSPSCGGDDATPGDLGCCASRCL